MRFGIKQKIYTGFFFLILVFVISAVISVITLNRNKSKISELSEVIDPSLQSINDFNLLITESKMLITNWVYLRSNETDKNDLKLLHEKKYPSLKKLITLQKVQWEDKNLSKTMDTVFIHFEDLLSLEKTIMNQLVSFENYEDPMIKIESEGIIENEVLIRSHDLLNKLKGVLEIKKHEKELSQANLMDSSNNLRLIVISLSVFLMVIGIITSLLMVNAIIIPLNKIKQMINNMGRGELIDVNLHITNDEIGEMTASVKNLTIGLQNTASFSNNIGQGALDSDFQPLSEKDVLGKSLITMRDNLKKVAEEENQRSWISEGLAKFSDILRSSDENLVTLCDKIISNMVRYLNANQGGLFLLDNENGNDYTYIELISCYAYEKKKFLNKRIEPGHGLIGQCIMEKEILLLTDVPEDYIHITSGLGEAPPGCILIVPLKINDEVYGAIELASFIAFKPYQIELIQRLAENIASVVSSVRINNHTKKLLEQTQLQAEQMRHQEEEMRQNLEELMATQESIAKSNEEYKDIISKKDSEIQNLKELLV